VKGVLIFAPATLMALGACQMSPLTSEGLFGQARHDAGPTDASAANEAPTERPASDGFQVEMEGGTSEDGHDAVTVDAAEDGAPDAGCAASCGPGTKCDPASEQCVLVTGEGMLSGVVTDHCGGRALSALVGIAGRHQCSFSGKGAFFFSQLPLGTLELAVAKDGYMPFAQVVEVKAGGTIMDVSLTRAADPACGGQAPADTGCVCEGTACTH
jgi:hypothetical protein